MNLDPDSDQDPDRDPVIFERDLPGVKKHFCLLLFKVHLHNFSKIKSHKEVIKE